MTELSNKHNAINLSQGFPGFNPDPRLLELVCKYIRSDNNQYAPMAGIPALQDCIAEKIKKFYGRTIDARQEVTICDGATEGLFSVIQAVVYPNDEVIVFDPAYDNYGPDIVLAGAITRHVPL